MADTFVSAIFFDYRKSFIEPEISSFAQELSYE